MIRVYFIALRRNYAPAYLYLRSLVWEGERERVLGRCTWLCPVQCISRHVHRTVHRLPRSRAREFCIKEQRYRYSRRWTRGYPSSCHLSIRLITSVVAMIPDQRFEYWFSLLFELWKIYRSFWQSWIIDNYLRYIVPYYFQRSIHTCWFQSFTYVYFPSRDKRTLNSLNSNVSWTHIYLTCRLLIVSHIRRLFVSFITV